MPACVNDGASHASNMPTWRVAGPAETLADDCGLEGLDDAATDGDVGVAVCAGPEQASKNDPKTLTTIAVTIRIESTSSVDLPPVIERVHVGAVLPFFVWLLHATPAASVTTVPGPSYVRSKSPFVVIGEMIHRFQGQPGTRLRFARLRQEWV